MRDDRAAPVAALRHATRQSLRIDLDALVWPRALRQAAAVAGCLFGGQLLGAPVAGVFAGIGALLTAVWSTLLGGRREVTGAVGAVVALAVGTALGVWANQHPWVVVPLGAAVAAVTGALALRPAPWAIAGLALTFGVVVTGAITPFAEPAWVRGLIVGAGGAIQLALTVLTWPLQGVRPERRALRLLLRDVARQLESARAEDPLLPPVVPLPALSGALRAPQPFAARGALAVVRAEYRAVVELRRTVARFLVDVGRAEVVDAVVVRQARIERRLAARVCRLLAGPRAPGWRRRTTEALDELRAASDRWATGAAAVTDLGAATRAVADGLAAVAAPLLARPDPGAASDAPAPALDVYAPVDDGGIVAALRATAADPVAQAHALRMAAGVTLAVAAGLLLPVHRGYWIALVVLVVLRPVPADTARRVVARSLGTVLGVLLALPVLAVVGDRPPVLLAFGALLAGLTALTFGASYLVFTAGVTGFVCLLLTLSGDPIGQLATARVVDTGIGLVIVAVVAIVAPTWEVRRTGAQLAAALEGQLDYLALALERMTTAVGSDLVVATESRAVDGRLAARESLRRLREEPRLRRDRWDVQGPILLGLLERQATRSLVLHARLDAGDVHDVDAETATALRCAVPTVRDDLAAALRDGQPVGDLPGAITSIARRPRSWQQGDPAGADELTASARTLVRMREVVADAVG